MQVELSRCDSLHAVCIFNFQHFISLDFDFMKYDDGMKMMIVYFVVISIDMYHENKN